jgi:hypothetical protein
MKPDTAELNRHCPRELRTVIKNLPPSGDWRVVKTKDHYFLYDGLTRVACISNNASKPSSFIMKQITRGISRYLARNYA